MDFNSLYEKHVRQPLQGVVGSVFLDVDYGILPYEADYFSIDTPNDVGLRRAILTFRNSILTFAPYWRGGLREDKHFHIECALRNPGEEDPGLIAPGYVEKVHAIQASPWRLVKGEMLNALEVYGYPSNPQAVRLLFDSHAIMVTTGYADEVKTRLLLADGDDLLVFGDESWRDMRTTLGENLILLDRFSKADS